jgi:heme/copper-type cytochrome/quinol oxidase subunit 2
MTKSPMHALLSRLASLFVLVLVLFLPMAAFAQGTDQSTPAPTALQNLMTQILAIVVPILVTVVGAVAAWIGLKIKQKLHLDISDKTMQAWSDLAQRAALRAAEWARNKSKDLTDGKKLPGGEVMEVAVNWAIQIAEQQKLPDMAREKLVGLIEAELFKLRQTDAVTAATTGSTLPLPTV